MTDKQQRVLACLESFAKLERKSCDEVAWVQLKLSLDSRRDAERLIADARNALAVRLARVQ